MNYNVFPALFFVERENMVTEKEKRHVALNETAFCFNKTREAAR
jgi:hypothetical protein